MKVDYTISVTPETRVNAELKLFRLDHNVKWEEAAQVCVGVNMTLPQPENPLLPDFIRENRISSQYVWLDGECSWKSADGRTSKSLST